MRAPYTQSAQRTYAATPPVHLLLLETQQQCQQRVNKHFTSHATHYFTAHHCQQLVTEYFIATSNLALTGLVHLTLTSTNYSAFTGLVNLVLPSATKDLQQPITKHIAATCKSTLSGLVNLVLTATSHSTLYCNLQLNTKSNQLLHTS